MAKAANTQNTRLVHIGLIAKISPMAMPAKDEWDRASPIMEVFLFIITRPIIGMIIASMRPTIKDLLIKS